MREGPNIPSGYIHPIDRPGSVADPTYVSEAEEARQELNELLERKTRLWAHNSTCDRRVHKMPLDTEEWKRRREDVNPA